MSIRRTLPDSNTSRETALRTAYNKTVALGAATILSTDTNNRLLLHYPLYRDAADLVQNKKGLCNAAVADKAAKLKDLSMYTRDFLDNIIKAVKRGEYPVSALAMYGLAVENPKLPKMDTEQQILQAAENCVSGEAERIAAGGTALPMPTIAQVTAKKTLFANAIQARDAADYDLNIAQEALNALNPEADGIILKTWDEAETKYNEEAIESRRDKCRPWGVVYVSDTRHAVHVQAFVIKNNTAIPQIEATLTLLQKADDTKKADKNGNINFKTGFIGSGTLRLEAPQYITQDFVRDFGDGDIDLGSITMVSI